MKRTASAVVLAAALLPAPLALAGTATAAPHYPNCTAAHAVGVSNIHRGEPGYRPALDHDHDGVACEEPAGGHDETVAQHHEGTGSNAAVGSDTVTGSSSSSSSSGHQVAVIPQGGAETGDGSTEDHPVLWIAGVLLTSGAGLVGLAAVRRRRLAGRRRAT